MDGLDAAIAYIRAGEKPLAAYLFSNSRPRMQQFIDDVTSRHSCINDVMMFMIAPELPFGGVGDSGMGAYKGEHGFRTVQPYEGGDETQLVAGHGAALCALYEKQVQLVKRLK